MSKAKSTPRRQPSKATREDPGDVENFEAKVVTYDPDVRGTSREKTFIKAAQQLLEAKVPEDFIIIRGIIELGGSFPTEEEILTAVRKPENIPKEPEDPPPLKKPRKTSKEPDDEPTDLTEAILNEESRRTITVSPKNLPNIFKQMWKYIRYPIERCIYDPTPDSNGLSANYETLTPAHYFSRTPFRKKNNTWSRSDTSTSSGTNENA
jgi:hypothetical protein